MTVLYTRWRFDNYTQDQESNFTCHNFFWLEKPVKLCLLLSSFHFDEIFHRKFKIQILVCVALRRHLVAILGNFGTKIDLFL